MNDNEINNSELNEEKNNQNNNKYLIVIISLIVVISFLIGYVVYDKYYNNSNDDKLKNESNQEVNNKKDDNKIQGVNNINNITYDDEDENDETEEKDGNEDEEDNYIESKQSIEYDISYDENKIIQSDSILKEGGKYEVMDGYLTIENGALYFVSNEKKINTGYDNINEIYFAQSGEYILICLLLTNDGTLYSLGTESNFYLEWDEYCEDLNECWDIKDRPSSESVIKKEFKNVKKIESKNKYVDIKRIEIGFVSDDTEAVAVIGIKADGSKDLIRII